MISVISARKAFSKSNLQQKDNSNKIYLVDNLEKSFGNLLATVEAYPDLNANIIVTKLMQEISYNETILFDIRNNFNKSVNNFNIIVRSFPIVIFAKMLDFESKEYFEVEMAKVKDLQISYQKIKYCNFCWKNLNLAFLNIQNSRN